MSYESPITAIVRDIAFRIEEEFEKNAVKAVQEYGFHVNREELQKALEYDRNQYEKGYADAMLNAVPVVRCKDCKHYKGGICFFTMRRHGLQDDWFCADGEKVSE